MRITINETTEYVKQTHDIERRYVKPFVLEDRLRKWSRWRGHVPISLAVLMRA